MHDYPSNHTSTLLWHKSLSQQCQYYQQWSRFQEIGDFCSVSFDVLQRHIAKLQKSITSKISITIQNLEGCKHIDHERLSLPVVVAIPEACPWQVLSVLAVLLQEEWFDNNTSTLLGISLVPVDPTEGIDRLTWILEELRPWIILHANENDATRMEEALKACQNMNDCFYTVQNVWLAIQPKFVDVPFLFQVEDISETSTETVVNMGQRPRTNRLSHICYTSGTTGRPKGCMSSTNALWHYIQAKNQIYNICPTSRVLLCSNISFDPSFSDILATFHAGATLVLTNRQNLYQNMYQVLMTASVTHVLCTPTLWGQMKGAPLPTSLQVVALGGEPTPRWVKGQFMGDTSRLFNTYGVTEACVYQTAGLCKSADDCHVGIPFDGIVVDFIKIPNDPCPSQDNLCEIIIGGRQLDAFSAYFQRNALTEQRFIRKGPNNSVLYCTGDVGKLDENGNLVILGRKDGDSMVKINGIRIELAEIESALRLDDSDQDHTEWIVLEALAIIEQAIEDEKPSSLVACVRLRKEALSELGLDVLERFNCILCNEDPLLSILRTCCQRKARVVPSSFFIMNKIPQTSSGKVDRKKACIMVKACDKALSSYLSNNAILLKDYKEPLGRILADEILTCLNLRSCLHPFLTADASFESVGGDSLAGTRVVRAIYARHHQVQNSRHLGGQYGMLDGPFAVNHLLRASSLGDYIDFLHKNGVCSSKKADLGDVNIHSPEKNVDPNNGLYDLLLRSSFQNKSCISRALVLMKANMSSNKEHRLSNISSRVRRREVFTTTPLHYAAQHGDKMLVNILLRNGASVTQPDATGMFPAHHAILGSGGTEEDRNEILRVLLGDNRLRMKDGSKQSLFHAAARSKKHSSLIFLLEELDKSNMDRNVVLNERDNWGRTPLHWAILSNDDTAVKILLGHDADPNPPKPKPLKSSSIILESPMELCQRVLKGTPSGERIQELLRQKMTT